MRRKLFWVKMNVYEGVCSWASKCNHIGEVRVFAYVIGTMNRSDMTWSNTRARRLAICAKYELSEASIFTYLRNLVSLGLLIKQGRGEYSVSSEYIEHGPSK